MVVVKKDEEHKRIWICWRCDDKEELTAEAEKDGYTVSHRHCKSKECLEKLNW